MKTILSIACFLFILSGCSSSSQDSRVLTVWHWMTDRQEAFEHLANLYQEQTGVQVQFELYAPADIYSRKIMAGAQTNTLPEIFGILGEKKKFAAFVDAGFVADLSEEFAREQGAWEKALWDKALDMNRFLPDNIYGVKPGLYGVPIDMTNIQMVYNKDLFAKAGMTQTPRNFDQFLAAIAQFNRLGITSFVSGWGEIWMIDCFASIYALNVMGLDKVMATYRGDIPYTDEDWLKVFNMFETLRNAKAFLPGIVTKGNKYAEHDFALERAALTFNGSWCVNVYERMNPDLQYGVMIPPALNSDRSMPIWGGAGSSFVVHARTPKKAQAIQFLRWLTAKEQQVFLAQQTKNLPSHREALKDIPSAVSQFAEAMDQTTHPWVWPYYESPLVTEVFARGIQSIIIGEATPESVAAQVQQAKERHLSQQGTKR